MAYTVDELSVVLKGDASSFARSMEQASATAKQAADSIGASAAKITGFMTSLKGFATTVAAVFSALKVREFAREAITAFGELKDAMEELREEADANAASNAIAPWETDETLKKYREFATEIARATAKTDVFVLSLLKETEAMGLSGEEAQTAARAALGLAQNTKVAADWLLEATYALGQGKTDKLEKVLPELSRITDVAQRLQVANILVARGFAEAEQNAGTLEGRLTGLRNEFTAFKAKIGEVLSDLADTGKVVIGAIWLGLKDGLTRVAETAKRVFNAVTSEINAAWEDVLKDTKITWDGVKQAVEDAGAFIRLIVFNLGDIFGPVWNVFEDVAVTAVGILGAALQGLYRAMTGEGTTGAKALSFALELVVTAATSAYLTFKTFGDIVSAAWDMVASATDSVGESTGKLTRTLDDFAAKVATALRVTAAIAGALGAAYIAFKGVQLAVSITTALMAALHLQQVVSAAAWLAWTVAMTAASAVSFIFNAQLTLFNFLLASAGIGTGTVTIATLAAKAATWLWNAALVVTNALLAPAVLLAAAGTIQIVGIAIAVVGGAAWGAYEAARAVIGVLGDLDSSVPQVKALGDMLGRWGGAIREVVSAAKKDLPTAFALLQAHAALAFEEIKALFPPLFESVSQSLGIISDLIVSVFKVTMEQVSRNIKLSLADAFGEALGFVLGETTGFTPQFSSKAERAKLDKAAADARASAIDLARGRLRKVGSGFEAPITEGMKETQEAVEKARKAVADFKPKEGEKSWWEQFLSGVRDPQAAASALAKLKEEGKALTEKFQDPQEKFAARQKHLDELLSSGALGKGAAAVDVYTRAVAAAHKEILGATHAVQELNAVLVGSAADRNLLANYAAVFERGRLPAAPAAPGVGPPIDVEKLLRKPVEESDTIVNSTIAQKMARAKEYYEEAAEKAQELYRKVLFPGMDATPDSMEAAKKAYRDQQQYAEELLKTYRDLERKGGAPVAAGGGFEAGGVPPVVAAGGVGAFAGVGGTGTTTEIVKVLREIRDILNEEPDVTIEGADVA